jgi:acetoin utilization deacetylase AcuC-like enzyme
MLTVYSDDHHHHHATAEFSDGRLIPPYEVPARATQILAHLQAAQLGPMIAPEDMGFDPILRVHDPAYVEFLQTAWTDWSHLRGPCDALPFTWPGAPRHRDRIPTAIDARLGYYAFDSGTPITQGTWTAAYSAAQVALTAQRQLATQPAVFALCRPPGHHATQDRYGGYCFLNNGAIAAQALLDAGADRVAILDIDYHHGNGTQSIFYDRADVLFVSIHANPDQEYPFFWGYADERGHHNGDGFTRNYPLPLGTTWPIYAEALDDALRHIQHYRPAALIVSLGLDTSHTDPLAQFHLELIHYQRIGASLATLTCPTLFVLEGGYALDDIGSYTVALLKAFSDV